MISTLLGIAMMVACAAAALAAWALVPLLGLALFRKTRRLAGLGISTVSGVLGIALWIVAAIAIHTGLGNLDLAVGLGLTAVTAGVGHAAGWRRHGQLASLLPMGILLLVRQSGFSSRQLLFWALWVAAVIPLHIGGTWLSTRATASSPGRAGSDNLFQSPRVDVRVVGVRSGKREDLKSVAQFQKGILVCVLIQLIAIIGRFALPAGIQITLHSAMFAVGLAGAVFVFLLAEKVYNTVAAVLLGILALIPYIGLIVLLVVNGKATGVLRNNGIKVGLLGAELSKIY